MNKNFQPKNVDNKKNFPIGRLAGNDDAGQTSATLCIYPVDPTKDINDDAGQTSAWFVFWLPCAYTPWIPQKILYIDIFLTPMEQH